MKNSLWMERCAAAVLAASCSWMGAAQAADARADALPRVQGEVGAQARPVALELPARQVVQLRFAGAGLHLDLRDAQGRHLRRLAENGRGVQTAIWFSQGA
ncbi:MAG: enterochelin esterase, partial [Janthinobacterium sp.]